MNTNSNRINVHEYLNVFQKEKNLDFLEKLFNSLNNLVLIIKNWMLIVIEYET